MPSWYWFIYYPLSILFGGAIGYVFGWFAHASITKFHARFGRRPPFFPPLETSRQWGMMFGVLLAIAAAVIPVLVIFGAR